MKAALAHDEYSYHRPNPKHTLRYTKAKVPVPKINTHSWAALPGSSATLLKALWMLTCQRLLTRTHYHWLPAPLRHSLSGACGLKPCAALQFRSSIMKWLRASFPFTTRQHRSKNKADQKKIHIWITEINHFGHKIWVGLPNKTLKPNLLKSHRGVGNRR